MYLKCVTQFRSSCCARHNMEKKKKSAALRTYSGTPTHINTQSHSFLNDLWTPASPQGVSASAQSGPFQASDIYFQKGDDISWGTLSDKSNSFFPNPNFPLLMEVCRSVILQLQRHLQQGSSVRPNQTEAARRNGRYQSGIRNSEGEGATNQGVEGDCNGPSSLRSHLYVTVEGGKKRTF